MKIHYSNWPAKREWEDQDIREYIDSDAWDYIHLNQLNDVDPDIIREFIDKIKWDKQYNDLRNMWDRWDLKDQAFFKEFKKYIEICLNRYGEFGQLTRITHEF